MHMQEQLGRLGEQKQYFLWILQKEIIRGHRDEVRKRYSGAMRPEVQSMVCYVCGQEVHLRRVCLYMSQTS